MKKKGFVVCFIFVTLLIGCTSSPKLFVPKQSTVNIPNVGPVQYQEMLVYVDDYGMRYSLGKTAHPDVEGLFGYTINVSALGTTSLNTQRRATADRVATYRAMPASDKPTFAYLLNKQYAVPSGSFKLNIDGIVYTLDISSEQTVDTYVVYSKNAGLGNDARDAILNCSQLSIDGGEINTNGIAAIKKFIEYSPTESVLRGISAAIKSTVPVEVGVWNGYGTWTGDVSIPATIELKSDGTGTWTELSSDNQPQKTYLLTFTPNGTEIEVNAGFVSIGFDYKIENNTLNLTSGRIVLQFTRE